MILFIGSSITVHNKVSSLFECSLQLRSIYM